MDNWTGRFSGMMVGIPVKFIEPKMTTDVPARMESRNHFKEKLCESKLKRIALHV